ncbi:hypothetical protein AWB68_05668 [Caballeronia choica]|jgi:hypothetical protein|uniref:Uncharacterized protein n=1 Tax=Caballeronia choica TaxID=326476 RepID=A0A158KEM6_9BURK|nr:hypothetical protein AWB68_05668 [Caballeronia choica]
MAGHEIDDRPGARAELLCFLVATAAASRSLTHEWRVDHVVESCRIWLARHAVVMHWLERRQNRAVGLASCPARSA